MLLIWAASVSPIWLPLAPSILVLLYAASQRHFQVGERTLDEVPVFLRRLNWDEVRELFDRTREQYTRRTQSEDDLRKTMRANLLKAREFLARMSHNAYIVQEWANAEAKNMLNGGSDGSPGLESQLREIAQMAADFRSLSRMPSIKLTLWTTLRADRWPIAQLPSIAGLRDLGANGELDLILLYEELKRGAAKLALLYGQQFHDDVMAEL